MGMQADVISYSATLSACEKGQQWMAAVALLREMQQWQVQADVISYSSTISACEKDQHSIMAVTSQHQMQQVYARPDESTGSATELSGRDAAVAKGNKQWRHQHMREAPTADHSGTIRRTVC